MKFLSFPLGVQFTPWSLKKMFPKTFSFVDYPMCFILLEPIFSPIGTFTAAVSLWPTQGGMPGRR